MVYRAKRPLKNKRRRRYKKRAVPFSLATVPLKSKHMATLRYFEPNFTLDPGLAGLAANYIFSANGLYDPNITGTGHQPLGFDQLMAMYNHYVVIGAVIKVQFWNEDATFTQLVSLSIQASATAPITATNLIEQGRCKWLTLGVANSGTDRGVLTLKVNPTKFLGRSKPLSDPDLKGDSSNNPAEQAYFTLLCTPNNNTQNSSQVRCSATIDYTVMFIEPKVLTES